MTEPFVIARTPSGDDVLFRPALANRHGLITGATGTGKTVTLQVLAEHFSRIGVPVFLADVKGDLSGLAAAGSASPKLRERLKATGIASRRGRPARWCSGTCSGAAGFRSARRFPTSGPLLLGRLFGLNATQQGVLALVFKVADDNGLLLLDLKDLRAMLQFVGDNAREFTTAVRQRLRRVDRRDPARAARDRAAGRDRLFRRADARRRRPAADRRAAAAASSTCSRPRSWSARRSCTGRFCSGCSRSCSSGCRKSAIRRSRRWCSSSTRRTCCSTTRRRALLDKIEQVVRLIRSKGVGVYFVTQSPADVPDTVLGQLGNRVQHALRAFTPHDQKAVKIAADTMRPNPGIDTARAITELAVGEALVSLLDEKGSPTVTERAWIVPPASQIGPIARRRPRRHPQAGGGAVRPLRAGGRSGIGVREAEGADGDAGRRGRRGRWGR